MFLIGADGLITSKSRDVLFSKTSDFGSSADMKCNQRWCRSHALIVINLLPTGDGKNHREPWHDMQWMWQFFGYALCLHRPCVSSLFHLLFMMLHETVHLPRPLS
jgi:hypothetical protein